MFEIIVGIGCGIVISFVSVLIIGKIANSDVSIINSLIPKSITTPMGISLANSLNGIESITVVAIILQVFLVVWLLLQYSNWGI